jgi:protein-disulfide isomerase
VWRVLAAAALALATSGTMAVAEDKVWPIDVTLGKADAPTTVIEYFSLNCPHCARFEADPFVKLKKDFIDTGKVKWVMRDYPLNDVALGAAMIAHCSGDRYMGFVDAFFQTQAAWAGAKDPLAQIKITARLGGMDGPAVDKCLADNALLTAINARATDGTNQYKVKATPTFIIDGKAVEGEKTYDEFVKFLPAGK